MRTFIALELPEEFADELAGLARQLKPVVRGRFSPQENYRLTLAFPLATEASRCAPFKGTLTRDGPIYKVLYSVDLVKKPDLG